MDESDHCVECLNSGIVIAPEQYFDDVAPHDFVSQPSSGPLVYRLTIPTPVEANLGRLYSIWTDFENCKE